ncbi:MAG: hypothetical protein OEV05_15685, partial [Gammaproteobacteria bacterium]|nr:hypothetical protein [Gammaproteobacteria bacterium]
MILTMSLLGGNGGGGGGGGLAGGGVTGDGGGGGGEDTVPRQPNPAVRTATRAEHSISLSEPPPPQAARVVMASR